MSAVEITSAHACMRGTSGCPAACAKQPAGRNAVNMVGAGTSAAAKQPRGGPTGILPSPT